MKQIKTFLAVLALAIFSIGTISAQNKTEESKYNFGQPEHHLDGYSMNLQYQNGAAIHLEFYDGKVSYEWLTGPMKGRGNKDVDYRSKKIGCELYMVNWHETTLKDYLTFVFDFERMIVHNSVMIGYENKPERQRKTMFKGGIIDHLKTK